MAAEKFLNKLDLDVLRSREAIDTRITKLPSAELALTYDEYVETCQENGWSVRYSEDAWNEIRRAASESI